MKSKKLPIRAIMYVVIVERMVNGKRQKEEEVHFKSSIKNNLFDSSAFVIDMVEEKVLKTRFPNHSYSDILNYLMKNHPDIKEYYDQIAQIKAALIKQSAPIEVEETEEGKQTVEITKG